jgi:signal transduction histidine kinase
MFAEEVLIDIKFPIIIWKIHDGHIKCIFTNNKITNIKKDQSLISYLENNDNHTNAYEHILETDSITIHKNGHLIIFNKINDTTFYEVHYPECNSINVLYSISNKIRKPLQNIIGMLIMIDDSNLSQEQYQYFEIIKKSSYDIVSVINDVIDIVNLEKKNIKLNSENIPFKKLIDDIINVVSDDVIKKKLYLNYNIDNDVPDIICIDKPRLQQIIVNIIDNAVKFTEFGGVNIDISIYNKNNAYNSPFLYINVKEEEYNILFKIKDTGSGLDNNQKKIIDKLFEINNFSKTKSYKNYGFGLLISNYLCKLMNGHIWYKSELDIGTIIYFNIICKGLKLDK